MTDGCVICHPELPLDPHGFEVCSAHLAEHDDYTVRAMLEWGLRLRAPGSPEQAPLPDTKGSPDQ